MSNTKTNQTKTANRTNESAKSKTAKSKSAKSKSTKIKVTARTDAAKANVRELILTAARDLTIENGFGGLSIRKLAEKIGYAPGTIYLYFKNRDEIARQICLQGFGELSNALKAKASEPNARRRLTILLHAYAEFALSNPETYRLSFMENPAFAHEMLRAAPLESADGAGRQAFDLIVAALEELRQTSELTTEEDARLLAEMLWTATHGVVSLKLVHPAFPATPVEILIDKLIEKTLPPAATGKVKNDSAFANF